MDVNNAQLKIFRKKNAFSTIVRPQGFTQCVLLRNTVNVKAVDKLTVMEWANIVVKCIIEIIIINH